MSSLVPLLECLLAAARREQRQQPQTARSTVAPAHALEGFLLPAHEPATTPIQFRSRRRSRSRSRRRSQRRGRRRRYFRLVFSKRAASREHVQFLRASTYRLLFATCVLHRPSSTDASSSERPCPQDRRASLHVALRKNCAQADWCSARLCFASQVGLPCLLRRRSRQAAVRRQPMDGRAESSPDAEQTESRGCPLRRLVVSSTWAQNAATFRHVAAMACSRRSVRRR